MSCAKEASCLVIVLLAGALFVIALFLGLAQLPAPATRLGMPKHNSMPETSDPRRVLIKSVPYRWNVGGYWNYRVLWTDSDRMDRATGPEDYAHAIDAGAAHRIEFGTPVEILEIDNEGPFWWGTNFRVKVLDGPLRGIEGWVDHDAINGEGSEGIYDLPPRARRD